MGIFEELKDGISSILNDWSWNKRYKKKAKQDASGVRNHLQHEYADLEEGALYEIRWKQWYGEYCKEEGVFLKKGCEGIGVYAPVINAPGIYPSMDSCACFECGFIRVQMYKFLVNGNVVDVPSLALFKKIVE
jgi:hypothetical protein